MHIEQRLRGDGTNKRPCWINKKEDTHPFKSNELGFCQTSANEGSTNAGDKTLLGTKDNSRSCLKLCMQEYDKLK